jgi:hypothetical protein
MVYLNFYFHLKEVLHDFKNHIEVGNLFFKAWLGNVVISTK